MFFCYIELSDLEIGTFVENENFASSSLLIGDQPSPSQYEEVDYETEHAQRQKKLAFTDPVHNVSLKDTVQHQVSESLVGSRKMVYCFNSEDLSSKSLVGRVAKNGGRQSIRSTDAHTQS